MIKTTVVGSYPVPHWLRATRSHEARRDALLAVVKTQELAGIDVVSDGELTRWDVNHPESNGMIDHFVRPLEGVRTVLTAAQRTAWERETATAFRRAPPGIVVGTLGPGTLDLAADWAFFRELTPRPKKFTVTSPYMLGRTLADEYHDTLADRVMALAEILHDQVAAIDADIVQIDEAHVTGHPDDGALAAASINRVLAAVRGEKAVHLCFGNYGGQTVQDGAWDRLIECLNALDADHLVLELTRRPERELRALRAVTRPALGLGVIDVKDNTVETPDTVARRIELAASVLGAERIRYVHPDCGLWMLARNAADAKLRALVAGRDRFTRGGAP